MAPTNLQTGSTVNHSEGLFDLSAEMALRKAADRDSKTPLYLYNHNESEEIRIWQHVCGSLILMTLWWQPLSPGGSTRKDFITARTEASWESQCLLSEWIWSPAGTPTCRTHTTCKAQAGSALQKYHTTAVQLPETGSKRMHNWPPSPWPKKLVNINSGSFSRTHLISIISC